MNDIEAIHDIEALKQLKARYCRLLDAKDWAAWRGLFTDDFASDTRESGGRKIDGADEFIAFVRDALGKPKQVTVHQVHAPELELTSPTTARGIWALEDFVRLAPGLSMHGYGHYHETYEKRGGQWRIRSSTLTRLREDIVTPFFSVYISDWLRQKIIKAAARRAAA
ncbi:nuclear transport factor 2 family protein [Solimonas sp. K1W22B-7]|uniref:nuclear transport factor 2 family protein n=1 Tax=Solimonas sp. K1W22B-7 TaxID=2303331 RepID=UPI000E32F88A|nr:nuclear transport factor 2 family protein [Solimonas sp. K1W22B-7]AXQ27845.1 nuclear transport factor 2 family protein [Solimonas sp. K1W22B-7]